MAHMRRPTHTIYAALAWYPPLRRGLLIFYAALLGLWLPFVCWGAWAEPGHAHAGPHLVFAAPPSAAVVTLHDAHDHPAEPADAQTPVGAARPVTSLMPFLLMAALAAVWPGLPMRRSARLPRACPTRSADLPVPTPPPRSPVCVFAR